MIFLKTKRLLLRNFREEDLETVISYWSHPSMNIQIGQKRDKKSLTKMVLSALSDNLNSLGTKHFAIALLNDKVIGDIYLDINDNNISLGYTISYEERRKGYAYEMLSSLIDYLIINYPLLPIVAIIRCNNVASTNLIHKLGFIKKEHSNFFNLDIYIYHFNSSKKEVPIGGLSKSKF